MQQGDDPGGEWRRAGRHISATYFWHFAAIGAFTPFAALYYEHLGYSGLAIGLLAAMPSLAAALTAPIWGAVADARSLHRWLLRGAFIAAIAIALLATRTTSHLPFFLLICLLALVMVPIAPLLDSYAMTTSEHIDRTYGNLRVWGSIGYTIVVLVAGHLLGKRLSPIFLVIEAICLSVALLMTFGLPALNERQPRRIIGDLRPLLHNHSLLLLLLVAYLIASGGAIMYSFLGIHLLAIGGSASLVGFAYAINSLCELPVIFFGGWFLRRLGAPRLIALAIGAYIIRYVAYASITDPVWVLPVQVLHGFTYGGFLIASVTLVHKLVGRDYAATAQTLLAAVSSGAGAITGSLIGGALLDHVGTVALFWGAAGEMVIAMTVLLIGWRVVGFGDRTVASPTTSSAMGRPAPSSARTEEVPSHAP